MNKKIHMLLFVAGLLFSSVCLFAKNEDTKTGTAAANLTVHSTEYTYKTITLPDGSNLDLKLIIDQSDHTGNVPVVFFVHGGGWITGSNVQFAHQSQELAKNGITGVRLTYRFISQGGNYSNVIQDVLDAIDFVRQRKDEFHLDFTKVGLAGGSAGGHLAAMAAQLTPECICFDGFNGLYDAYDLDLSRFGGGPFTGTTAAEKKNASPIYSLKANIPNTYLYHGNEDLTIDINQSYRFRDTIIAKGGNAIVLTYEGVGHSFFNQEPYLTKTTQALLDHVSYVFGSTCMLPPASTYQVPPKYAVLPENFSIVGTWQSVEDASQKYQFFSNHTLKNYNNVESPWTTSYNIYYILQGVKKYKLPIKIINATTISISGVEYHKI